MSEDKRVVNLPVDQEQAAIGAPGAAQEAFAMTDSLQEQLARIRETMEGESLPNVNNFSTRDQSMHYFWASTTSKNDTIYRRQQMGYTFVTSEEFPQLASDFRVQNGQYAGLIGCNELLLMKIPMVLALEIMKINHYERPLAEEDRIQSEVVRKEYRDRYGRELGGYTKDDEGFKSMGQRLKQTPKFTI